MNPFQNAQLTTTLAVTDIERAKDFYGNVLGLREVRPKNVKNEPSTTIFEIGPNNNLCVYERPTPSGSTATACAFEVNDVEAAVRELRNKGIEFEEYDLPEMGLKTKNGIATEGDMKTAWFKDPDGNILAIGNSLKVLRGDVKNKTVTQHA